jgi:hypothetical protein
MAIVNGISQFIKFNTGDTLPTSGVAPNAYAINLDTNEEFLWNGTVWEKKNKPISYTTGFWDYNDLATQTTPFTITGGAGYVNLPNDGLGTYSLSTYKPDGLTDIWLAGESAFDFSELALGDQVEIRFTANVATTVNNTHLSAKLRLGNASPYDLTIITEQDIKAAGTYQLSRYTKFYIGNTDTLNGKGHLQMSASNNVSVVIEGWYVSVLRRS